MERGREMFDVKETLTENRKEKYQKYKTTLDIYLHHIQFNRIIVYLS